MRSTRTARVARTKAPCAASVAQALNQATRLVLSFLAKKTSAWPAARLSQSDGGAIVSTRCSMFRTCFLLHASPSRTATTRTRALRNVREASRSRSSSSKVPQALRLGGPAADGLATVTLARVHALRSDLHMFTPWCVLASFAVFVAENHLASAVAGGLQRQRRSSQNAMMRMKSRARGEALPRQPRLHPRDPVGVLAVRVPRARHAEHARDAPVFPRGGAPTPLLPSRTPSARLDGLATRT